MTTITLSQQYDETKSRKKVRDDSWHKVRCTRCGFTQWTTSKFAWTVCADCLKQDRIERLRKKEETLHQIRKAWSIIHDPSGGYSEGSRFYSLDIEYGIKKSLDLPDNERVFADKTKLRLTHKGNDSYYQIDYAHIKKQKSISTARLMRLLVKLEVVK